MRRVEVRATSCDGTVEHWWRSELDSPMASDGPIALFPPSKTPLEGRGLLARFAAVERGGLVQARAILWLTTR